jgi:hypothetical protein
LNGVAGAGFDRVTMAVTRGFVVAAGSQTFNLVCIATSVIAALFDTEMTAVYAPQRY